MLIPYIPQMSFNLIILVLIYKYQEFSIFVLNFIMHVTTFSLDHLGIVSGTYDELKVGSVIDEVLPKVGPHKLAHSIVVKAMILNCLGFTDSRLYMLFSIL